MRAALSVPVVRTSVVGLALTLCVGVFAGCRTGSPLHDRYNNFRAYYNAYYNASRKLDEAERQLERSDQAIDRTRLLSVFPDGGTGQGSGFQEAIDKSTELLRYRPTSKWADDALLIIGKAYYYRNNLVGAEQKFLETIELARARRQDRLADEARVWLGRTLGAAERYEEGVAVLQEGLAEAGRDRRQRARLHLILGELYARAGRYAEAAPELREGVRDERDSDLAARALVLLAQVLEEEGDFAGAADAYQQALRKSPPYELGYAARLSRALVLGLDLGQHEEALDALRRMRRDDKNYDNRAEVELAFARVLAASGQLEEAQRRHEAVLYDETLAGGTLRGEAHARLAEYYRDYRRDFVRAAAHYDSAATSLRTQAGARERYTRAALLDLRRTADAYGNYAVVAGRLAEVDSLIALGDLDEEPFRARIAEIEQRRAVEFREERRRLERIRDQQAFSGGVRRGERDALPGSPGQASSREAGFLGWKDQTSVQTNLLNFLQIWGDRPLVPNWRRNAAIEAATVTEVGDGGQDRGTGRVGLADFGPPPLDLSSVPRTPEAMRESLARQAALRYEVANALFLSLSRPDSAAVLYDLVLGGTDDAELLSRTRFALAETETALGRPGRVQALYETIALTADDPALRRAAELRLGADPAQIDSLAALDAIDPALTRYAAARERWREGSYATAVGELLAVADEFPDTETATKARLGAAIAYIDWARRDDLDLLAPLPLAVVPASMVQTVEVEVPVQAPVVPVGAASDSLRPPVPDPAFAPDSLEVPPDSVALVAPASDSLAVREVEMRTVTEQQGPTVRDLLEGVVQEGRATPFGQKAQALLGALPVPEVSRDTPDIASDAYGLRGVGSIDPDLGGFAWRVEAVPNSRAMAQLVRSNRRAGYRVSVAQEQREGGPTLYLLLLGQFPTAEEAETVRDDLPEAFLGAASAVVPIDDLDLVDPDEIGAPER